MSDADRVAKAMEKALRLLIGYNGFMFCFARIDTATVFFPSSRIPLQSSSNPFSDFQLRMFDVMHVGLLSQWSVPSSAQHFRYEKTAAVDNLLKMTSD